jgi:ribose transport system substrate-binding protein
MKNSKTRIALLCSLLTLALTTLSCAGNDSKKIKIGVSIPAADHGWTAGVGYWAKTEMDKYPDIEWVYATANEPGKQTSDIEDMMTQNVNGLVLLATEPNSIAPVAKKGQRARNLSRKRRSRLRNSHANGGCLS